jgi:hypothetical protein
LSQGRLFLKNGEAAKLVESQYGREVVQRALQRQHKNKWKSEGEGALFSRGSLWGVAGEDPAAIRVHVSAIAPGTNPGQVFYALDTDTVSGLFSYDIEQNKETRIFHRENLHIKELSQSVDHNLLACSQHLSNGTANIAICRKTDIDLITEGDSLDEAPSWVPGARKQLVFQSAGVARNPNGYAVGLGPFTIQKLDLEDGNMSCLKEEGNFDFLSPRVNKDGHLFFIRRPYEKLGGTPYPLLKMFTDFALFPFRLMRAIFHYLNFFSLIYSKKPLTTASGPKIEGVDQKTLLLRGRIIDAQKVMQEGVQDEGVKSLVPASWQLVKHDSAGAESTLAKGVVAFDIGTDGSIIYTNGNAIYRLDENGSPKLILKANLIDTVVALA